MTRQEIIEKAKVILLPDANMNDKSVPHNDFKGFLSDRQYIYLNNLCSDDIYNSLPTYNKDVYFKPEWCYQNIIPALQILCMLPYSDTDFVEIQRTIGNNVFHVKLPVESQELAIQTDYMSIKKSDVDQEQPSLSLQLNIDKITSNEMVMCHQCVNEEAIDKIFHQPNTPYHHLFKYSHGTGVIINQNAKVRKTIFISGGSELSIVVPILTQYYGKIIFLDNRFVNSAYSFSMFEMLGVDKANIDEVVFIMNPNKSLETYTEDNLF